MKKINSSPLSAQKGFTLIELVVVIVILGILAATAAPRFVDLTSDAEGATLQAVRASVESATSMAHAKALVDNELAATGSIDINGATAAGGVVTLVAGWPDNTTAAWNTLLDVDTTNANAPFSVLNDGTSGTDGRIVWFPSSNTNASAAAAVTSNCFVSYTESTNANIKPVINVVVTGC